MPDRICLMAHLVAGYPDDPGCEAIARGLVEGGASYLEVQIPFSDPSADGPDILGACSAVLARGYAVEDAFLLVDRLRRGFPGIPIFIMAYASLVVTPGADAFAERARASGAAGLIVPDLPFDSDEGLEAACGVRGLSSVPVAAPSMRAERLAAMASLGRPYLYAALRSGITGARTTIREDTRAFLAAAGAGGARVLGGFGIRTGEQSRALAPSVHAVVAGSVFVEAAGNALSAGAGDSGRNDRLRKAVRAKAREIVEG